MKWLCMMLLIVSLCCFTSFVRFHKNSRHQLRKQKNVIVLAAWYLGQPDAQATEPTHFKPSNTYKYMQNFYESATFLDIPVLVFHDSLKPWFVKVHETKTFKFIKTDPPPPHISPQDWRFFKYYEYLQDAPFYDAVIFADLSDSFFFHDPFEYMRSSQKNLFITRDVGTLQNNMWMRVKFKLCYNVTELPEAVVYNDGVWGGKVPYVYDFLTCFVHTLQKKADYQNCNMMAMNVCANKQRYIAHMEDPTRISNPYLRECGNREYPIIHNKCIKLDPEGDWNNQCITIRNMQVHLTNCD
jgi:hypothetical protein